MGRLRLYLPHDVWFKILLSVLVVQRLCSFDHVCKLQLKNGGIYIMHIALYVLLGSFYKSDTVILLFVYEKFEIYLLYVLKEYRWDIYCTDSLCSIRLQL